MASSSSALPISPRPTPHIQTALALSPRTSSLPLPTLNRANRSFANLARLFGIGGAKSDDPNGTGNGSGEEGEDEAEDAEHGDEDEDGEGEVDEESLMWDAQTALISHQPVLAMKYYTIAALPPHRSPAACLALGNLLTRGTGFAQAETPISPVDAKNSAISRVGPASSTAGNASMANRKSSVDSPVTPSTAKSAAARLLGMFYNPPSSPTESISPVSPTSPTDRRLEFLANGWSIPRAGKRAVRDVEGMGVAGGWFVLGLGWLVEDEKKKERERQAKLDEARESAVAKTDFVQNHDGAWTREVDSDDALVFGSKAKTKQLKTNTIPAVKPISVTATPSSKHQEAKDLAGSPVSTVPSTVDLSNNDSSKTDESTVLKTPYADEEKRDGVGMVDLGESEQDVYERLKLMFELLLPLLSLYRHGQIQAHDPPALPPISPSQLPSFLQPQGDLQKRRNVYGLGGVVASTLAELPIIKDRIAGVPKRTEQRRSGVAVMVQYLLALTAQPEQSEIHFRNILNLGQTGIDTTDELVKQAADRLEIILRSPPATAAASPIVATTTSTSSPRSEYPFPRVTPKHVSVKTKVQPTPISSNSPSPLKRTHQRIISTASARSVNSLFAATRVKSTASLASLVTDIDPVEVLLPATVSASGRLANSASHTAESGESAMDEPPRSAVESLRRVRASYADLRSASQSPVSPRSEERSTRKHGDTWWPSLHGWSISRASQRSMSPTSPSGSYPNNASDDDGGQSDAVGLAATSPDSGRTVIPTKRRSNETISAPSAPTDDQPEPSTSRGRSPPSPPRPASSRPTVPLLRTIASSPSFPISPPQTQPLHPKFNSSTMSSASTPRRRLPFDPESDSPSNAILPIDPALAAAELASALTKHVTCSVCGVQGINFPECRKCGLIFCSRACRVDSKAAGDGKRHVCGLWETRKLLCVPAATPPGALRKMARRESAASMRSQSGSPSPSPLSSTRAPLVSAAGSAAVRAH